MHPKYDSELPEGWQGGNPVTKYWNGNYIHLYRVTRCCASCQAEISIDVTKQALDGTKKNAGLLLRNCPKCRAARKAGGVGSRGGTSRPTAGEPVQAPAVDTAVNEELERLRTANATMKEELDGLYVQLKELREQIARHEGGMPIATAPAPVRTYKLPSEPLTMAESTKAINAKAATTEELLQKWLARKNAKMPWEDV
jgi:hypothetical protein